MNNENHHPVLHEPPAAHALHRWDEKTRTLTYEYNGRKLITLYIPGSEDVGFRHGSDGNMLDMPFTQQIYVMLDHPIRAKVSFVLSSEAVNMRPHRAEEGQAILGQVGHPLIYGVNGLYDIQQDLLVEWYGRPWSWMQCTLKNNGNGELIAELEVELGPMPFIINLKMHYYRTHLGYSHHKPWEWRPDSRPIAGWCSWEACRRKVSFDDIRNFSEFFGTRLKAYGLEYIQLDDGYEKTPIPYDTDKTLEEGWLDTNEKFPGGHKGVVDTVKSHGLKPAIWTNANVTNTEFAEKNEESFLKDNGGNLLLGEWIDYILDCSEKTLKKHVYTYYKKLSEEGYTYFKTDAIRHLIMDGLHEAVRQGLMTNDDARERFYFLASWGVLAEVVGVADACRIAMDANPTWAGIRMQIVESARWFHTQRILFLNDPDHICARTNTEWLKSVISLVSLSGSLLMLSDPLEVYTDERIEIIRKNLPTLATVTAETGPLDMSYPAFTWTKLHGFAVNGKEKPVEAEDVSLDDALNMAGVYPTMHHDHPISSLWSIHIDTQARRWCVVGRFAVIPLKESEVGLEKIGLDPEREYLAFDFWEQKFLGRITKKMTCGKLGLGHCQIISLCPVTGYPQFIASSRHVSMDIVSIQSHSWHNGKLVLEIKGVPDSIESYWIYIPENFIFESADIDAGQVTIEQSGEVIRAGISFAAENCTLNLHFRKR